ncbi:MAG: DUF401 family protein [Fervidicoccaceae archaeon]
MFFIASVSAALSLIALGINVSAAMGIGLLIFSIPSLGYRFIDVLVGSFNREMLNTITSLFLSMMLAYLYRGTDASKKMVASMESLGRRFASASIPAVIGLLPMPAGAYISAGLVDPVYEDLGINKEQRTFINYWFRHIWSPIWPLYQSIILASALLGLSFTSIVSRTWPISLSSVIAGTILAFKILPKSEKNERRSASGLVHLWPFALIALLSIAFSIPLPITLIAAIALFSIIYRVSFSDIEKALRYSLDLTLISLMMISFIYGNAIDASGLPSSLTNVLSRFSLLVVFLLPFLMVFSTGFEFTFVALAFPAIEPLLGGRGLSIAFLGGYLGSMLSPSHACLIMSAKFYRSSLGKSYRYVIKAVAITAALAFTMIALI